MGLPCSPALVTPVTFSHWSNACEENPEVLFHPNPGVGDQKHTTLCQIRNSAVLPAPRHHATALDHLPLSLFSTGMILFSPMPRPLILGYLWEVFSCTPRYCTITCISRTQHIAFLHLQPGPQPCCICPCPRARSEELPLMEDRIVCVPKQPSKHMNTYASLLFDAHA